ncbi:MAG: molybdopterin-dependent oxidoreductase [Acidobacteria bacterium]|nr:molybdopterin-dependent oxidoreductase [Acidobacteriota bacterium]
MARSVYTNTAPTGAFRGVSGPHLVFALERHMDHIALELGMDRREFRLGALAHDGDAMLNGQVLEDASILAEAFAAVEDRAPWAELSKGPNRGVGIAATVWLTNPMPGQATVKLNEDGTLGVVTAATDNGSGAVTMGLRQIAAEGLGLFADQVVVSMPDTDVAAYDAGSQGSRTTHVVGRAVFNATAAVRRSVEKTAASMLEAAQEDIVVESGFVQVRGVPSSRISLAEVATTAMFTDGPIAASASYVTPPPTSDPTCATGMLFSAWPIPTYHVHVAEVEVDPVTGKVAVLRYVVAQEVGGIINPDGVEGQIQGAVAQGIGHALWERLDIDAGRYMQRSLETYGLPLAVDMPDVEMVLLEHASAAGPYGVKGVAEPPIVPVAAAIANAVADALGQPIDELPITPEAVLDALQAQ